MSVQGLTNVTSKIIKGAIGEDKIISPKNGENSFGGILNAAINNITETNKYISAAENEKLRVALGEAANTHDLTIAMSKSTAALQYTVALRDKFMEAYREIMQMQI